MPIINLVYEAPKGWTPWSNTVAYYPLISDTNDYSWNSHNWNNDWVTFVGSVASQNVWYFNWSSRFRIPHSNDFFNNQFVISFWFKYTSWWATALDLITHWWDNASNSITTRLLLMSWYVGTYQYAMRSNNGSDGTLQYTNSWLLDTSWHNVINVYDNKVLYLYKDGTLLSTKDNSSYTFNFNNITNDIIVWDSIYSNWNYNTYQLHWYLSNLIFENKARTAEEISAYYNQTKSTYGL